MGKDEKDRFWNADRVYEKTKDKYRSRSMEKGYEVNAENMRIVRAKNVAGKQARKAYEEYMKTPLGKITKLRSKIYKGKEKVASFLEKKASDLRNNPKRYY